MEISFKIILHEILQHINVCEAYYYICCCLVKKNLFFQYYGFGTLAIFPILSEFSFLIHTLKMKMLNLLYFYFNHNMNIHLENIQIGTIVQGLF